MFSAFLQNVRKNYPHIHCITNYVTANDCANILLACGGSPIMANCPAEAEEITAACDGLLLNTGTLNPDKLAAMLTSGKTANALQHPVILDPVGAGASQFRTNAIHQLMKCIHFDVIRGNLSEIKALFQAYSNTHGVDASQADALTAEQLPLIVPMLRQFAFHAGTVLSVTGQVDVVTDGENTFCLYNGTPMMQTVTGSGCQLSALTAAFVTANPEKPLYSAAAAVCTMGVCGEIAAEHLKPYEGNASFRNALIDAVFRLDSETLAQRANYQMM